jgi:hypothetical protein
VFTFAKLGFKVIGLIEQPNASYVLDNPSPSVVQFWPLRTHRIAWPAVAPPLSVVDLPLLIEFAPYRKT